MRSNMLDLLISIFKITRKKQRVQSFICTISSPGIDIFIFPSKPSITNADLDAQILMSMTKIILYLLIYIYIYLRAK